MCRAARLFCALAIVIPYATASHAQSDPFALLFGDESAVDAGSTDTPGNDDIRLVTMRMGTLRLDDAVTGYERQNGLCVVAEEVFARLEAPVSVTGAQAAGWFVTPERTIDIDFQEELAHLNGEMAVDLSGAVAEVAGKWCIESGALSKLLPIDFDYDANTQTLRLQPRETLPLEAKLARQRLQDDLERDSGGSAPQYRRIENGYRWISWPTADIGLGLNVGSNGARGAAWSLELAADFLKTTARVRTARSADDSTGVRMSLSREFDGPQNSLLPRHFRAGDIVGFDQPLLQASRGGRGIAITNRPAYIADVFDTTDIRGPLPAGWEAELYRDGHLAAFVTEPDQQGEYAFANVEIRPGYNRYEVRLFGPHGETNTRDVEIFVGDDMHPENELQYSLSLIQEGVTLDGETNGPAGLVAAASVSYGISRQLSTRLDARATGDGAMTGVASVMATWGETYGVARLAHSTAGSPAFQLGLAHQFEDRSSFDFRFINFGDEGIETAATGGGSVRQTAALRYNGVWPFGERDIPLDARLTWEDRGDGTSRFSGTTRLASNWDGYRWSQTIGAEMIQAPGEESQVSAVGNLAVARNFGATRLRAELGYRAMPGLEVESFSVAAQRRFAEKTFGQLALERDISAGVDRATASFSRDFGKFIFSASGGMDSRGAWSAGLQVSTSLFRSRTNGFSFAPPGISRTGAVQAHIFDDIDGDGEFGDGDRAIEGVSFLADHTIRREASDSDGRLVLTGLAPHRSTDLELVLASLGDPYLQPLEQGVAVKLRPGQTLDVNVPLSLAGEAELVVNYERNGRLTPVSGVIVRAMNAGGQIVGESKSEYDGYVYLDRLPMGHLTLTIDPQSLASLGATAAPIAIDLTREAPSALGLALKVSEPEGAAAVSG